MSCHFPIPRRQKRIWKQEIQVSEPTHITHMGTASLGSAKMMVFTTPLPKCNSLLVLLSQDVSGFAEVVEIRDAPVLLCQDVRGFAEVVEVGDAPIDDSQVLLMEDLVVVIVVRICLDAVEVVEVSGVSVDDSRDLLVENLGVDAVECDARRHCRTCQCRSTS